MRGWEAWPEEMNPQGLIIPVVGVEDAAVVVDDEVAHHHTQGGLCGGGGTWGGGSRVISCWTLEMSLEANKANQKLCANRKMILL